MEILDPSILIIKTVLNHEANFQSALKKYTKDMNRPLKIKIASFCGMYFRNFFLLSHFCKEFKIQKDSDLAIYLGLTFINNAFRHYEDDSILLNELFSKIDKSNFENKDQFKDSFNKLIELKRNYEFKKFQKGSLDYFSCRFNLPIWILKSLTKQYGRNNGLKIAYSISKMPIQFASLQFQAKNPSLSSLTNFTKIDEDLYKFNLEDKSIKKEPLIHEGYLYPTQKGIKNIFDGFSKIKFGKYICFIDNSNTIAFDFLKKYYAEDSTFYFLSSSLENSYTLFDKIRTFKKKNISFDEINETNIESISTDGEDVILYSPANSDYEALRKSPEYGIYFNAQSLDDLIERMKNGVISLSKKVRPNGYFIYFVPTLNQKETIQIKEHFLLNTNDEFELIDEKTYYPYQEDNSLFYYFIFRRK